jgi:glutaminyl-tRNA synthetase
VKDLKRMNRQGAIEEVYCTYDPDTRSGRQHSEKKVKGTLHWVSAKHAVEAEVRLYDRLFNHEDPAGLKCEDYRDITESRFI